MRVYYEKLGHMLKPLVPKFGSDLSVRLRDIAEKQVLANLKPIVAFICALGDTTFHWLSNVGLSIQRRFPPPELLMISEWIHFL